jgi:hypothetical protein
MRLRPLFERACEWVGLDRVNRGLEFSVAMKGLSIGIVTEPESKSLHLGQLTASFQLGKEEDFRTSVGADCFDRAVPVHYPLPYQPLAGHGSPGPRSLAFNSSLSSACSSFARVAGWTGAPARKRCTESCDTPDARISDRTPRGLALRTIAGSAERVFAFWPA